MKKSFDLKRFLNNINYLIKIQNRKIGDVEKAADVSAGYLSRINKEGGKPNLQFAMNIAEALHTSIDSLLKVDMVNMTATEQYVLNFLNKVIDETSKDLLAWKRNSYDTLVDMELNPRKNIHPLFTVEEEERYINNEDLDIIERAIFYSNSFSKHTRVHGDCFWVPIQDDANLFVMDIEKDADSDENIELAKEVWIALRGGATQYLCSNYKNDRLAGIVNILYDVVEENVKHPKVDPNFRNVIDAFMHKDDEIESTPINTDDEIPF